MVKKILVTIWGVISFAFAGEYWNVPSGGVTMKFLAMEISPRSEALSGAGIASPSRASEVTRNPLAMSSAEIPEFGVVQTIMNGEGTDKLISAYYAQPLGKSFTISGTLDYLGYDDIEGRDENGLKTGDYGAYAWSGQVGIGSRNKNFNWGLSARFATQTIEDETAYAILGNIGSSFKLNSYIVFGAALTNLGFVTEYDTEKEYAPMALQAGITGFLPFFENWKLAVSLDAYRRADTEIQGLFGAELTYAETLMLRIGTSVRKDESEDYNTGLTCGIGFSFGRIVFDYGYAPRLTFEGGNHHIALGLRF